MEVIDLSCAACLLAMSHSDRQYACNLRGGGGMRIERGQSNEESNKTSDTYIPVPRTSHDTWYCCMFEIEHIAARHGTEPHHRARHRTALRCAAEL